ncbi:MAG: hydroxymyristoyl-ACP dehydratase [Burkholderiaceae bacterium]
MITLDQAQIRARLPHTGDMCLLRAVSGCDARGIRCVADSHRLAANPLRTAAGLGAANAVEYAAQAMALHAMLQQPDRPQGKGEPAAHGMLASVRRLVLHRPRLDDLVDDLSIRAVPVSLDGQGALYEFDVRCAGQAVAEGRAIVLFPARQAVDGIGVP